MSRIEELDADVETVQPIAAFQARIGAPGDAREPHLHFEVTTSSRPLAGEGAPYVIGRYRYKRASDGPVELHIHELPLDNCVVIFGKTAVSDDERMR